jgi:hypothetical protein
LRYNFCNDGGRPLGTLDSWLSFRNKVFKASSPSNAVSLIVNIPLFPPEYRRLENLVDIGLSNNAIEKLDDATFENLNNTNVRKIELSRNKLSEITKIFY